MRRRFLITMTSVTLVGLLGSVAMAGGATWSFDGYYRPGEVVRSSTTAEWGHNPDLGTPEDGPFFVYLSNDEDVSSWPGVNTDWMLVGFVEVNWTRLASRAIATARFEIPDIEPGEYHVFHCNDPCTTTLGDVVGGWGLRVVSGDGGPAPEVIAAEVAARFGLDLPDLATEETELVRRAFDVGWLVATSFIGLYLAVDLYRTASGWAPE